MPIEWGSTTRRGFLGQLAVGGGLLASGDWVRGADPATSTVALLSDTHLAADPQTLRGDCNMSANFARVRAQVLECPTRPSDLFINGDCAFLNGQPGDYQTLVGHLRPVREAGRRVWMNLGNHDDRSAFREAFAQAALPESPVVDKQATMVDAGPVRWFLLDSLEKVNDTPGTLGEKQLTWLDQSLAKHADKPALVMAHHHVDVAKLLRSGEVLAPIAGNRIPVGGLTDGNRLLDILQSHRHVSAYFFGHTHQWNILRWEGISLVNLPCVAYPFTPDDPNGWVLSVSQASRTDLELCALDAKHQMHGQKVTLPHRGA